MTPMENIKTYSLKYNIGQIILPDTNDDSLLHPSLHSTNIKSGNHWQYSITSGSTLLHVTKPESLYFGQQLDLKIFDSVGKGAVETLATVYHDQKDVPVVKHLCPNVSHHSISVTRMLFWCRVKNHILNFYFLTKLRPRHCY